MFLFLSAPPSNVCSIPSAVFCLRQRRPPAFGKQVNVTQPIIGPKVHMVSYLLSVSERACLKHEENGEKFPSLAFHLIAANVPVILIFDTDLSTMYPGEEFIGFWMGKLTKLVSIGIGIGAFSNIPTSSISITRHLPSAFISSPSSSIIPLACPPPSLISGLARR